MSERAYRYRKGQASELIRIPPDPGRGAGRAEPLVETLADHDDALLEKVLEDIRPTPEELYRDMRKDLHGGRGDRGAAGCGGKASGVRRLWKALRHETPTRRRPRPQRDQADGRRWRRCSRPLRRTHRQAVVCPDLARRDQGRRDAGRTRLGGIYRFDNGELAKSPKRTRRYRRAGAVGRRRRPAPRFRRAQRRSSCLFREPPPPVYALAVATTDRKDDVKLSARCKSWRGGPVPDRRRRIRRPVRRCCTARARCTCRRAVERLAKDYGLKVTTRKPQVAYKETIRRAVHEHGRLKRQTGGHGQFADVKIDIAPRARGAGFRVRRQDRRRRGAAQFHPGGWRGGGGIGEEGPFGFPVVDVSVTLVDGGFHAVDSSDMAFKTATRTGDEGGAGEGRAGAAGADRSRHRSACRTSSPPRAQRLLTGGAARSWALRTGGLARLGRRRGAGAGGGAA